ANAVLPEALIAAGVATDDDALLATGLDLLGWLLDTETRDDHLSLTPAGGWAPGEARPGFDQQPIEAATIADACARAFSITQDPHWSTGPSDGSSATTTAACRCTIPKPAAASTD